LQHFAEHLACVSRGGELNVAACAGGLAARQALGLENAPGGLVVGKGVGLGDRVAAVLECFLLELAALGSVAGRGARRRMGVLSHGKLLSGTGTIEHLSA